MSRLRFLAVLALVLVPRAGLPQGAPLGPEFRVNTYTTGHQRHSSVAADGVGDFVVVWDSDPQDGSYSDIFGQRYSSSGTPLGPEFRVNAYTTGVQSFPSVAADGAGGMIVVWTSDNQDGDGFGTFGQRYSSSGAPLGPEFRVNTYTISNQWAPSVAATASGDFVVVWNSYAQDGSNFGIFGQRYASGGVPLGPEFRVNTYTAEIQIGASVAADPSGNFLVVWNSWAQDGSADGVFGQRYSSSGTPLGPEFSVNTYTTENQLTPRVAADASGNFVVVWTSGMQDGSSYGVFGQRYSGSGVPLGPEFLVNTQTTGGQRFPSVAADPSGSFVVAWSSLAQDGSNYGVFGQRYSSSGAPLGPEFRVNTYTTGFQAYPSVATDATGNFVLVWNSFVQDGDGFGTFGQRYSQIVPVELMGFGVE